jgi:uncharacterized coiled-coil protein SlyX
MQRRDFDYGRDYYHDYGSPKRPRHRPESSPLFERDEDRTEARLAEAERALREQRQMIADLAGLLTDQQATIDLLRAEAVSAFHECGALKAQLSYLEEFVGERAGDLSLSAMLYRLQDKVSRNLGDSPESSDAEGSDAEDDGEESDGDGEGEDEWEHEL